MRTPIQYVLMGAAVLPLFLDLAGVEARAADDNYWLITTSSQLEGEMLVNNYPLAVLTATNSGSKTSLLDSFLVAGENVLTLRCADPINNLTNFIPTSAGLRLEYGGEDVTNRAVIFDFFRATHTNDNQLVEEQELNKVPGFHYFTRGHLNTERTVQIVNVAGRTVQYRFLTNAQMNTLEIHFQAQARLASLPWQDAAVELAPTDRTEIAQLSTALHTAFSDRHFDAAAQLLNAKLQRLAVAYGTSLEEQIRELKQTLAAVLTPDFVMEPLEPSKFQYQSYGSANLYQVLVDGHEPIRGSTKDYRYRVPIFVSKVDGRWVAVE